MQAFGQGIGLTQMAIPINAGAVGVQSEGLSGKPLAIIADEIRIFHTPALVKQGGLEASQRTLRMPVHLADAQGMIAQITQHLRHLIVVMLCHLTITKHTMPPRRLTGQQTGTGRRTARCCCISMTEKKTIMGQTIDIR